MESPSSRVSLWSHLQLVGAGRHNSQLQSHSSISPFRNTMRRSSTSLLQKVPSLSKSLHAWNSYFQTILGDCSYSFQGSSKLIRITITVSFFSRRKQLQERIPNRNWQEFLQIQLHDLMVFWIKNVMISKRMLVFFWYRGVRKCGVFVPDIRGEVIYLPPISARRHV